MIGFGQKNLEIGFLIGGISNKTLPSLYPIKELDKYFHAMFDINDRTLAYGVSAKINIKNNFSLKSKILLHTNKTRIVTTFGTDWTFGDVLVGEYYLPIGYSISQENIQDVLSNEIIIREENFNFLSIPILLEYNYSFNNSSLFINSGFSFDYLSKMEHTIITTYIPQASIEEGKLDYINKLDVSLNFGVGLSHLISKKIKLSIEAISSVGLRHINNSYQYTNLAGVAVPQLASGNIEQIKEYNLFNGFSNTNRYTSLLIGCSYILGK